MTRDKKKIQISTTYLLEITKYTELLNKVSRGPVKKRSATRRFLKEKSLKCRSAERFKSVLYKLSSAVTPTPISAATPKQLHKINTTSGNSCSTGFDWDSILDEGFFSGIPLFQVPAKHDQDSKSCLCEACVENPANFDLMHLFSDEPLEFASELKRMIQKIDAGYVKTQNKVLNSSSSLNVDWE